MPSGTNILFRGVSKIAFLRKNTYTSRVKDRIFEKADIGYLESVARNVGVEVIIPSYIRQVQALKDKSIPVPGNLDPEEAYLLLEIAKKIQAGAAIPDGFGIYLNDRKVTDLPEDVPTMVKRQKRVAFNNLVGALTEVASKLKKG